jgi:hypothetical protein
MMRVPMPVGLDDEERQLAEVAYSVAEKFADCGTDDREALAAYWVELGKARLHGLGVPEEFGGAGEGIIPLVVAAERTAAAGYPSVAMLIGQGMVARMINLHGTDVQRQSWLPGIADGQVRCAFGLTEAGAGSNAPKMTTTARADGDRWRIRGEKTYISDFDKADLLLLAANTPDHGGVSLFLVADPGSRIEHSPVPMRVPLYEHQFTLYLHDLQVPAEDLLAAPGKGMRALFSAINYERLLVGAFSLGLGRYCLWRATEYARERVVFDQPIGAHQAVQHPLAEAYVQLEAAWALLLGAARNYRDGSSGGALANAAKIAATDAGFFAAERAMQTHGGSAFTTEVGLVERYMATRLFRTAPVTRELALSSVASEALGLPRSY